MQPTYPVDPYTCLALLIHHELNGLQWKRPTRFRITAHLTGIEVTKSTRQIPRHKVEAALDKYFPEWRTPLPLVPPEETQMFIRELAEGYSYILIKERGEQPDEERGI